MDTQSTARAPANVMGQVRCVVEKHGRKSLSGYKKRFLVVNYARRQLQIYKNDQSHEPGMVFSAEEIRGVIYAGEKQNKFYAMMIQTRVRQNIKCRMNSLADRERWARAVTQLIEVFSTNHRTHNVFEFLQRRTRTVASELQVSISMDWPRLLTVSHDVIDYTVEATENALANVSSLVRGYGSDFPVPRNYTLNVQVLEGTPTNVAEFPGPQYDPVKESAVLNVVLYRDAGGHVKYFVNDPEEVIAIMQSNVFRNPVVEGWISKMPGCAAAIDRICEVLRLPNGELPVSFQWGQHFSHNTGVEKYLRRHVNESFFLEILAAVQETLHVLERMLEEVFTPRPVSNFTSASGTPRSTAPSRTGGGGGGGGDGFGGSSTTTTGYSPMPPPQQQWEGGGGGGGYQRGAAMGAPGMGGAHNRSFSASVFLATEGGVGGVGGGGNTGRSSTNQNTHRHGAGARDWGGDGGSSTDEGSAAHRRDEIQALAVRLVAENITGLGIVLEKQRMDDGKSPPPVVAQRSIDYETRCRPAFLLVAKYRQAYGESSSVPSTLHEQLFEIAFHAFLGVQISLLRSRLTGVFDGRVKVAVLWDNLLHSLRQLNVPLVPRDLPHLVDALATCYLPRVLRTVQMMASKRADPDITSHRLQAAVRAATSRGGNRSRSRNGNGNGNAGSSMSSASARGGGALAVTPVGGRVPGALPEESDLTLLDVFLHCVGGIVIDFAAFPALVERHGGRPQQPSPEAVAAALPAMTLVRGTLTDHFLLCSGDAVASAMVGAVNQCRGGTSRTAPVLVRGVFAYAATPRLGEWCERYFAAPEHVARSMAAPHSLVEDEFESDSDVGTAEPGLDMISGENVAKERSAEGAVLNMERVVGTVYDSQGVSTDLKISAERIYVAIHSLQNAFPGKKVTKHDIIQVLVMNLRRLRSLYSRATDGEANSLLDEATAVRLLRDFCEYEDSEALIDDALQERTDTQLTSHARTSTFDANPADAADATASASASASAPAAAARREEAGGPRRPTLPPSQAAAAAARRQNAPGDAESVRNGGRQQRLSSDATQLAERSTGSVARSDVTAPFHGRDSTLNHPIDPEHTQLPSHRRRGTSSDAADGDMESAGGGGGGHRPSADRRLYNFEALSYVALNVLLPREAVFARKAWRTGFVFGLENAGKSHVVHCIQGLLRPTVATVGLHRHVVAFDEWVFSLNELGGRESFRKNWRFYSRRLAEVHFLLHVVDCSNSSTYDESIKYLRKVANHFHSAPMVVVFNNYQVSPSPVLLSDLAYEYELDRIQKINRDRRIFPCLHELCPAHSTVVRTPMQEDLRNTLRSLSDELYDQTPPDDRPLQPKGVINSGQQQPHRGGGGGGGGALSPQTSTMSFALADYTTASSPPPPPNLSITQYSSQQPLLRHRTQYQPDAIGDSSATLNRTTAAGAAEAGVAEEGGHMPF